MAVTHAWEGAVTDTGFRVRAKVTGTSTRLVYSTSSDLSTPTHTSAQTPTSDGIVTFDVTGLTPDTRYWWALEDDAVLDAAHRGTLTTDPPLGAPASFTVASSSCCTTSKHNDVIFDTIRGHAPRRFIHTGDFHYANINTNDVNLYRAKYDEVLSHPRQEQLYREVPVVYMWDDHDFGPGNSDKTTPARPAALQSYRERVPHYPLAADGETPVYQSFQIGRVLFIVTDLRADKDPNATTDSPTKTCLGATQKAWFFDLLATSTASALVWVSTSPYLANAGVDDTWGKYTYERDEIVAQLNAHGWLDRMCVVSGDIHALCIDDGTNNAWGGFPVYQFASLTQTPNSRGGPYTYGPSEGGSRYGLLDVEDQGSVITITGTGYIGDSVWESYSFDVPAEVPWVSSDAWVSSEPWPGHPAPGKGVGEAAWSFTGAAAGASPRSGTATGALAYMGAATGSRASAATATGSFAFVGVAVGSAPTVDSSEGTAAGIVAFTGTAAGTTVRRGAATGSFAFTGLAVGDAPTILPNEGAATGTHAWAGTATGARASRGSGSGVTLYLGGAVGSSPTKGTAIGQTTWVAFGFVAVPTEPSTDRTVTVAAENRTAVVPAENRTTTVPAESRLVTV